MGMGTGTESVTAAEYRDAATRCLKYASEATTIEARSYWLTQAQFWHGLATHIEGAEPSAADRLAMLTAAQRRRHDRTAEN